MASDKQKCPVCKTHDAVINDKSAMYKIDCPLCGHYRISSEQMLCEFGVPKHLLSGVLRNTWEFTGKEFDVYSYTVDSIASLRKASPIPIPNDTDITAKADLILKNYRQKYATPGDIFNPDYPNEFSFGFCKSNHEFAFCFDSLIKRGYIEFKHSSKGSWQFYHLISPEGWAYLSGIGAEAKDQGFIAMAFKSELNPLSEIGLHVGIENAGYKPLRIDRKDHNNRIDDEIVAEIRKSKFVVADLTGKNAGAYFEAGFAMGLGKPVIWTCRQSEIDAGNVHFDTRQYSIVSWEPDKFEDFAKRLTQRIEATIGRGKYVAEPATK